MKCTVCGFQSDDEQRCTACGAAFTVNAPQWTQPESPVEKSLRKKRQLVVLAVAAISIVSLLAGLLPMLMNDMWPELQRAEELKERQRTSAANREASSP